MTDTPFFEDGPVDDTAIDEIFNSVEPWLAQCLFSRGGKVVMPTRYVERTLRQARPHMVISSYVLFHYLGWPPYPTQAMIILANRLGIHPLLPRGENWSERHFIEQAYGVHPDSIGPDTDES